MLKNISIQQCLWCVIGICGIAGTVLAAFFFYFLVIDTPHYFNETKAFLVTVPPIFPGTKATVYREYDLNISTSTFIADLAVVGGLQQSLKASVFANKVGSFKQSFDVDIPKNILPDHKDSAIALYQACHIINQNPIRDAIVGPDIICVPDIDIPVVVRP